MRECQSAFSGLIEAIPTRVRSASTLQRALRIDMKLAWKTWKVAHDGSLASGAYMPGRPNIRKLLAAAGRCGIPSEVLEGVAAAAEEFDHLVATHAGDRPTFDSMVGSRGSQDLRQRRAAFRANLHLRGAQARVQLKSSILCQSTKGDQMDLVAIQGYHDLRRVRSDGALVVSQVGLCDDDGRIRQVKWEPLGPSLGQDSGSSVLGAFCSEDLPPFRTVRTTGNFVVGELAGQEVGNRSAITYIDGYLAHGAVPKYKDAKNNYCAMLTRVPIPCEVLVMDLLVQEGALGDSSPAVASYGGMLGRTMDSLDRLPMNESVQFLGRGLPALHCPDIERHVDMYAAVLERLGWMSEQFDVFRCRIAFPVMLSLVQVRFELPEAPKAP